MKKIFRKFLLAVVQGVRQAMVISPGRAYVLPAEKSFSLDAVKLQNDAKKIGSDLNREFR